MNLQQITLILFLNSAITSNIIEKVEKDLEQYGELNRGSSLLANHDIKMLSYSKATNRVQGSDDQTDMNTDDGTNNMNTADNTDSDMNDSVRTIDQMDAKELGAWLTKQGVTSYFVSIYNSYSLEYIIGKRPSLISSLTAFFFFGIISYVSSSLLFCV